MKILKLKALNINSLKGEVEIDFRTFLNDNALFAITGPTGAGKSTILDIITCALYGRTPRLKNPNDLMSRHTGECYCEVEFEIKGTIYRSSWAQKRARKSGQGKFQTAKMEISDVQSQKVIKATLRDVPKYIEELSGLDFDRFKQSMVLAQGGFDAFLKADEKERSTLLEKMTGTQIYKEISQEIYEQYVSHKADIDMAKNVLDNTELLESSDIEEKTIALEANKVQKQAFDTKEKELIRIKTWSELYDKLEFEHKNYSEYYASCLKEKEERKEDFHLLALSNKALNVESHYTQYTSIVNTIVKDEQNHKELISQCELINKLLVSQELFLTKAKENSTKAKEHYEEETKKIKDLRVVQTKINEKQKSLSDIDKQIESIKNEDSLNTKSLESLEVEYKQIQEKTIAVEAYIQTHKKDEKLLEVLPLLKKNIEDYSMHNTIVQELENKKERLEKEEHLKNSLYESKQKETVELKAVYESINSAYSEIQTKSAKDNSDEERLIVEHKKQEVLIKTYSDYIEYKKKIENEKALKTTYSKEQQHLKETLGTKQSLVLELKVHIQTLREKKDTELLVKKYEEDRKLLSLGDACYLCGSTDHPYIQSNTIADRKEDTNNTVKLIEEKEHLLSKEETDLKAQDKSLTLLESKITTSTLELEKVNILQKDIYEVLQKEAIEINDETKVKLEEKLEAISTQVSSIKQRRKDKDNLLKQRDDANKNYSTSNKAYIQQEKERTQVQGQITQLKTDEEKSTIEINALEKELKAQYSKYGLEFNKETYKENYEVLNTKKEMYAKKLEEKKTQEIKTNQKVLEKKELEVKLTNLKSSLKTQTTSKEQHEAFIKEQKEKSTKILNIADIEVYEEQVNKNYQSTQDEEKKISDEVNKNKIKTQELEKQEKILKAQITSNTSSQKQIKQKLDLELASNDFEGLEALKEAILPKEKREALSLGCNAIEEKYTKYKTLKTDTSKKLEEHKKEELQKKPLDEVDEELKELNEKIDDLQKNIGSSEKELEINTQNKKKNEEKIKELEKKKEAFKVWVKLNEMIGSADGNKFAKFAQGITLDQLISLANNHLRLLSSRYELQRSVEQKQLLEIEVCDSFQGNVIRPVSTLSGGESFIVSLSLALGLSELASQKIAIDSLFLDEGFGTLDEDSLETALNALNLLQSRGKMVGVISHVEALKERIPLQIKVEPRGDGSSFVEID